MSESDKRSLWLAQQADPFPGRFNKPKERIRSSSEPNWRSRSSNIAPKKSKPVQFSSGWQQELDEIDVGDNSYSLEEFVALMKARPGFAGRNLSEEFLEYKSDNIVKKAEEIAAEETERTVRKQANWLASRKANALRIEELIKAANSISENAEDKTPALEPKLVEESAEPMAELTKGLPLANLIGHNVIREDTCSLSSMEKLINFNNLIQNLDQDGACENKLCMRLDLQVRDPGSTPGQSPFKGNLSRIDLGQN